MSSEPQKHKPLQSDLFMGIGLTFGVLGVLLLVGAVLHVTDAAGGVWFVWLFITRTFGLTHSSGFLTGDDGRRSFYGHTQWEIKNRARASSAHSLGSISSWGRC
jgi:hypothetical protein